MDERITSLNNVITSQQKEIEKLKREMFCTKLGNYNIELKSLKMNMEKAILESANVTNIEDYIYIDEIIQYASSYVQQEISPIDIFEAYSDDLYNTTEIMPTSTFELICEKIGIKFDAVSLRIIENIIKNLNPDEIKTIYRSFSYALKGVLFKQFRDKESFTIGKIAVEKSLTHKDIANNLSNEPITKEKLEMAVLALLSIEPKSQILNYIMERTRTKDSLYDYNKLTLLIEKSIETYLLDMIRNAIKDSETEADILFAKFDTDHDKIITIPELKKMLHSINLNITENNIKYVIQIFDFDYDEKIKFAYYCKIFEMKPELCNVIGIVDRGKISQDMSIVARRCAKTIVSCAEGASNTLTLYDDSELYKNGILNTNEAVKIISKLRSRELKKPDILVMLKEFDIENIGMFCCHTLGRRIVELAEDKSSLAAILKRILSACMRKGPPLNNVNGFIQTFAGRGSNGQMSLSRFKIRLMELVPGFIDSEIKVIELEYQSMISGNLDIEKLAEALFSPELKKTFKATDYKRTKTEFVVDKGASIQTQALKGKLDEVKRDNEHLKLENNALMEKIAKMEKMAAVPKFDINKSIEQHNVDDTSELLQYSAKMAELEKTNYDLMRKIDANYKPSDRKSVV